MWLRVWKTVHASQSPSAKQSLSTKWWLRLKCFKSVWGTGVKEKSISNESLLHALGGVTPWIADILAKPDPFLTRFPELQVFPDRQDTLDRRPGPKVLCCCRRAETSVDILALTSPLCALFRVYQWKFSVWTDAWETCSVPWKLERWILWWAHHIPTVISILGNFEMLMSEIL